MKIYRGILTGYNDAFIIDGSKKDELIAADPKSAEIIRPILRGRDIKRYSYANNNLWLIYIPWHFPLHQENDIQGSSNEAESLFKEQYPAVYNHLYSYKKELSNRNKAETGIRYEWYALQRWGANYSDDFSRPKIVYREISDEMNACMVESSFFLNNKCYFITGEHLEYLLCIFNSKLFNKIILKEANLTGGKGSGFLNKVKIPKPDEKQNELFKALYNKIVENNLNEMSNIEKEIDYAIYSMYGLNDEEIMFIES